MPDPQDGGCWFCNGDGGEMAFSYEFDCYVHIPCVIGAYNEDNSNPEARIMMREFGFSTDPTPLPVPGRTE